MFIRKLEPINSILYTDITSYHTLKPNNMKKTILTILATANFIITAQAQYSTYYNADINQNVNANVNINKNVNVSGTVYEHKTISTIDYGALQLANAQREKNRLENIKYADEQQRQISLEVASNPLKAYTMVNKILLI